MYGSGGIRRHAARAAKPGEGEEVASLKGPQEGKQVRPGRGAAQGERAHINEGRLKQSLRDALRHELGQLIESKLAERLPRRRDLVEQIKSRVLKQLDEEKKNTERDSASFDEEQLMGKLAAKLKGELQEAIKAAISEQLAALDLPGMVAEEVIRVAANFRSQLASRAATAQAAGGRASMEERLKQVPTRQELEERYVSREEFEQLQTELAYSQRRLAKVKREKAFNRRYVFPRPDGKKGIKFQLLREDLQKFYGPHWHEIFQQYRRSEAPETLPLEFRQHLVELEKVAEGSDLAF